MVTSPSQWLVDTKTKLFCLILGEGGEFQWGQSTYTEQKLELVFLFSKSIKQQGSVKNNWDHLSNWVCAPIRIAS